MPGRINEVMGFRAEREGVFYGNVFRNCCGMNHAFMPIAVRAGPSPGTFYNDWLVTGRPPRMLPGCQRGTPGSDLCGKAPSPKWRNDLTT